MSLKGSKTEENLKAAFAGESQANRRYLYFAAKADVEGYNDVAAVFRSTDEGETGHAHGHLEYLEQCGDPATGMPFGGTAENLKTAIAGEDANWGRIVMAVGKSGGRADRDRLSIRFGDILVAENGQRAAGYSEDEVSAYMTRQELLIGVDLGIGTGRFTAWTCDLTHRYIDINADYRS